MPALRSALVARRGPQLRVGAAHTLAVRALAFLVVAAVIALAGSAAGADDEFPLEGTWYLLVHYRDADAAHPERDHWDDRIWVFERKGSRIQWTEYPIVVFNDRDGRFERSAHGQQRVLHAWEPNAGQRQQIETGLEFNTRGSKTKSLRKKREGGWRSSSPSQTLSASVVGYQETWAIDGLPDRPVFTRDDLLGSQRAEKMTGRTLYETQKVSQAGKLLRGTYARDESLRGTFRLMRAGEVKSVGTKRSQRERLRDALQTDGGEPGSDADGGER